MICSISVPKINPYNLFLKEEAAKTSVKISPSTIAEFAKSTSSKWKSLGEAQKSVSSARVI